MSAELGKMKETAREAANRIEARNVGEEGEMVSSKRMQQPMNERSTVREFVCC